MPFEANSAFVVNQDFPSKGQKEQLTMDVTLFEAPDALWPTQTFNPTDRRDIERKREIDLHLLLVLWLNLWNTCTCLIFQLIYIALP
jgi:hypothetical protein